MNIRKLRDNISLSMHSH